MTIAFFLLAIVCRSVSELALHGKLKWSNEHNPYSFWGEYSYTRKYNFDTGNLAKFKARNNLYYRLFNIAHREAWPTSATFTVFLTDGMHLCQFFYHIFLSLGIWQSTGYPFLLCWGSVVFVHFLTYRILQK